MNATIDGGTGIIGTTGTHGSTHSSRFGRFGRMLFGSFAVLALALVLVGSFASPVGAQNDAPPMDKGAFKSGCEAGGGSFVDNVDGSFQCNLKGGGTIKCANTTSPCTYTALTVSVGTGVVGGNVANVGNLQVSNDAPAPSRHPVRAGAGVKARQVLQDQDDDL